MADRWFDDDELQRMSGRTLDHLVEAIADGDAEEAERLARRMYGEFLSQHDGYVRWVTSLLSEIGRRWGDDALEEVMTETVASWWIPNLETMAAKTDDDRVKAKMFAAGLRGHLQPLSVEEDDDKIVMQMHPCGSGGRLIQDGAYKGERGFLKVAEPQTMTYGRRDFPVYCAHEAAMERVDIEHNGRPLVVVEPAERLGEEPCSFVIYKDRTKVPEKYYRRLGMEPPDSGS